MIARHQPGGVESTRPAGDDVRNSASTQVELGAVCGVWVGSIGLDTDAAAPTTLLRHAGHRGPFKGIVVVMIVVAVHSRA